MGGALTRFFQRDSEKAGRVPRDEKHIAYPVTGWTADRGRMALAYEKTLRALIEHAEANGFLLGALDGSVSIVQQETPIPRAEVATRHPDAGPDTVVV